MHIRIDDIVEVIAGDDKGKRGKVLAVNREAGKVTVQGVNLVYRHMKPSRANPQGGRLSKEMPLNASNVQLIDPSTNKLAATIDLGAALDPFGVAFDNDGTKAYVSNWTGRSVGVIDTSAQKLISTISLSPPTDPLRADHPTAIVANPRSAELYVANASSDTVSVIDGRTALLDVGDVDGDVPGMSE